MSNVEIIVVNDELGGTWEKVIIDHGNGEFTQMAKSVYDEQQVEHLTEIPTPDEA